MDFGRNWSLPKPQPNPVPPGGWAAWLDSPDGLRLPPSLAGGAQTPWGLILVVHGLRLCHPDIPIFTRISGYDHNDFFVTVDQAGGLGHMGKLDSRWRELFRFNINVFAKDPDGEARATVATKSLKASIEDLGRNHWGVDGFGYFARVTCEYEPIIVMDYISSSGPVQFAELPPGWVRAEARFSSILRSP